MLRLLLILWLIFLNAVASVAAEHLDGFDSPLPTWNVELGGAKVELVHRRNQQRAHAGIAAEELLFRSPTLQDEIRLSLPVPPAQILDELEVSLWVRTNRPGIRLALRVRFPEQVDPRSGKTLTADLLGEATKDNDNLRWRELRCPTNEKTIQRLQQRLQLQIGKLLKTREIDTRNAYVDQVALLFEPPPGETGLLIDDLKVGPIVTPPKIIEEQAPALVKVERITIGDDRMMKEGSPYYPRFTPDHGEPVEFFRDAGFNLVWVDDCFDRDRIQALHNAGLGVMATPPRIDQEERRASSLAKQNGRGPHLQLGFSSEADGLTPDSQNIDSLPEPRVFRDDRAALVPFDDFTAPILFWNLGARIPIERLDDAAVWAEQIRDADRKFSRPVIGDVAGREREFHRVLSLLGTSKHYLNTTISPLADMEILEAKRLRAMPGKPIFTLIQTEPADATLYSRLPTATVPVVEPEQILLQGYAALSAGYKGIGYWNHVPLNEDVPGAVERRLALKLLNLHIQLLEPWLATGKFVKSAEVQVVNAIATTSTNASQSPLTSAWDRPVPTPLTGSSKQKPQTASQTANAVAEREIRSSVYDSEFGRLVLTVWHEEGAQCQPGVMSKPDLRILIPPPEAVQAWKVTTTKVDDFALDLQRVPGGNEIHLKNFDLASAVVVTSDAQLIKELKRRVQLIQSTAAQSWVELAKAKLSRVEKIHRELEKCSLAPRIHNAPDLLFAAHQHLTKAQADLTAARFDEARTSSLKVLQFTRVLQRLHWENAVGKEPQELVKPLSPNSPRLEVARVLKQTAPLKQTASHPHTICFQTLPDHWRMQAELASRPAGNVNMLVGGDFEDANALQTAGWTYEAHNQPRAEGGVTAGYELHNEAAQGRYALRLTASPNDPTKTTVPDEPFVHFLSPAFPVQVGQIVRVTGRIKLLTSITGHPDGLMIYDSLKGTVGALRFQKASPNKQWQTFEMVREVPRSGEFQLTIELHGFGDVRLDDLRASVISINGP